MIYIVARDKATSTINIFECLNKNKAEKKIESAWDTYNIIAIFEGSKLSYDLSWVDVEKTVIKKQPKIEIKE